jgi:P pilus assembly chaperone PapD
MIQITISNPQAINSLNITNPDTVTLTISQVGVQGASGANGKGVPVGGNNGYVLTKSSNADYDTSWQPAGSVGSVAWGNITGTLSSQTDLQNQLNSLLAISVALS